MDHFIRRIDHYVDVSSDEINALLRLHHTRRRFSTDDKVVNLHEKVDKLFIVEKGWLLRERHLENGRRQIINFLLPGDYFDLMSLVGAQSDHSIIAATDAIIRIYDGQGFLNAIQASSKLASAFWWVTVQEESILRQQIVRIGRLSAQERIANFILELNRRQTISEGATTDFVPLPVPQAMLADALGLSIVHISRSLTSLRAKGLIKSSRKGITILDRERMMELADFDPIHLKSKRVELT